MPLGIVALQKIHKPFALGDHFQKAKTRAVVFGVLLQMLGQRLNFFGKQSHLGFRRTGILVVKTDRFQDF